MMGELFAIRVPIWEILLRGTCIYWFVFLIFRFVLRRDAGSLGLADILLIVLIADAAQNGMAGEYKSVSEGFVLIATLAGWNGFFDAMSFRFKWFARFAEPPAVVLVRGGKVLAANLRRHMVTRDELKSQIRAAGIDNVELVQKAVLESDGTISVIPKRGQAGKLTKQPNDRSPGA
jgi:uncharacterized membrane protein YcaP (DUF421 family)